MTPTITAAQRDALYEEIVIRLSGIDAVWLAVKAEDFETAERLGRELSDELLLVLDDLGWGQSTGAEGIELTTRPDVLRRILPRMRDSAVLRITTERDRAQQAQTQGAKDELVRDTCKEVLATLGDDRGSG